MVDAERDLMVDIWEYYTPEEKLEGKDLQVLIKMLEKERAKEDESLEHWEEMKKIENAIGEKLGLVSQDVLQKWQKDILENVANEINDLTAKFRNHRHDFTKHFTSKAEY